MIKNLSMIKILCGLSLIMTLIYALAPVKTQKIPLEVLFGDPIKATFRISPNGNYISYLALGATPETKDILNVWVRSYDKNDDQQVTFDTQRPICRYFWSFDNDHIFYLQDKNGDENWSLYCVNKNNPGNERCLTPYDETAATVIEYNRDNPNKMLLGLNKDNPEFYDVYLLDIPSNKIELKEKNSGLTTQWLSDKNLEIKGAIHSLTDGKQELFIKNDQGKWESHYKWNADDIPTTVTYAANGNFYFLDYVNSSTNQLIEYDPITKERRVITSDPDFDIEDFITDNTTDEILAVRFNKIYREYQIINPDFATLYNQLRSLDSGTLHISSYDQEKKRWIVAFESDITPIKYYIYDNETASAIYLGTSNPELEKYKLCKMEPISYMSRDGLKIHGYLTQTNINAKQPLPLVLLVHGGPWARDSWGYDPEAQLLANRGYNVLQINFRGSLGFGKHFEEAGNKEWGRKMHYDLLDGIEWLSNQGMVDPKKIAIYGASYGGYAALIGASFTPDVFCCAIDLVGPSNLVTLLQSIPPYWKCFTDKFNRALGNLETEKELLMERSPLSKVDQIKIPLLIAQGAHDPRVKKAESEQIVEALISHDIPHTYKLYEDEGHGFVHTKNQLDFYQEMEKFLNEHMPVC